MRSIDIERSFNPMASIDVTANYNSGNTQKSSQTPKLGKEVSDYGGIVHLSNDKLDTARASQGNPVER